MRFPRESVIKAPSGWPINASCEIVSPLYWKTSPAFSVSAYCRPFLSTRWMRSPFCSRLIVGSF